MCCSGFVHLCVLNTVHCLGFMHLFVFGYSPPITVSWDLGGQEKNEKEHKNPTVTVHSIQTPLPGQPTATSASDLGHH